jgi:hypothetical protein
MSNHGIDYGMGTTNIDRETGIRYGVISVHEVTQAWCDSSEADYGEPRCPECGNDAVDGDSAIDNDGILDDLREEGTFTPEEIEDGDRQYLGWKILHHACGDYACDSCRLLFDGEDAYGDEPLSFTLDDGEYKAEQGSDGDIFIFSSPYYTYAQFCSPCAPGACYLMNPTDTDGPKAYCFSHDWFDGGKAPYPVYRVSDGTLVEPE